MNSEERTMTPNMQAILRNLREQPKRNRTENGLVEYWVIESYDGRTLNALAHRGLIRFREFGVEVSAT